MQHLKKELLPKGTTLIELCVVLALCTLILTISLGCFHAARSYVVRSELYRLHMIITYLRRKAILEEQVQKIVFSSDGKSYRDDREWYLSHGVIFGIGAEMKGPPSDPKHIIADAISWPRRRIDFGVDGTISAGAAYLTDSVGSCFYALTVDASAVSGVRCYRYQNGWKLCERESFAGF